MKVCQICGECLEPTEEAMKSQICGYCRGVYNKEKTRHCFDGSPCTKSDQDCNTCKWMKK